MSDTALATELMDEMIGFRGVREGKESMLRRAYRLLVQHNRKNWEGRERRIRSIFDGEARRVDFYEIADIRAVIEARKHHAEFKAETARMASLHLPSPTDQVGNRPAL